VGKTLVANTTHGHDLAKLMRHKKLEKAMHKMKAEKQNDNNEREFTDAAVRICHF